MNHYLGGRTDRELLSVPLSLCEWPGCCPAPAAAAVVREGKHASLIRSFTVRTCVRSFLNEPTLLTPLLPALSRI